MATSIQIMRLFNSSYAIKRQSGICQGQRSSQSAYGPTLPSGWELVAAADFNGDDKPGLCALQRRHASNSDLVSEQQRLRERRLRPNSSGQLEPGGGSRF